MLVIFVALAILATEFYFASFGMLPTADHFEYIIVGAGPADSLLVRSFYQSSVACDSSPPPGKASLG